MSAAPAAQAKLPDPEDVTARGSVQEAIIILGRLYSDVSAAGKGERLDPYQLQALAGRVAREGMRASRRLKKAAGVHGDTPHAT